MKQGFIRFCSILMLVVLIGIYILPSSVYAANFINELIEDNIQDDVIFDATIGNEHWAEANLGDEVGLNLSIKPNKDGYLKNVNVILEDANYVISKNEEEINQFLLKGEEINNVNRIIHSIEKNKIVLKEIDKSEELNAIIPVMFNKKETVSKEDLEKETDIKLKATYVNGKDEDKEIEKDIKVKLKWKINAENEINQQITRNVKFNNNTIISFEIEEGIKGNAIPEESKELEIEVPKLNELEPAIKTVVGNDITKEERDGKIIIKKDVKPTEEGKYSWNTREKYVVTYIYNTQIESGKITQIINKKAKTIQGNEIQGKIESEFELNGEVGSIVELQTQAPEELNKGYIYTNLNRQDNKLNTDYVIKHTINLGYVDLVDRISIDDGNTLIKNENSDVIKNATDNIKIKDIAVKSSQLDEILGEHGKIIVKNEQGEQLGVLDRNLTELAVSNTKLTYEITKAEKEGNIEIFEKRTIIGDNNFNAEEMTHFRKMDTSTLVKGYMQEMEITNLEKVVETQLVEPESKASIDLNTDALSTITGNKDVEFNVTLNKTEISDMLYANPVIKITLPEEVRSITFKSAKIIYDEELLIEKVEQNERSLVFYLTGTQTQYNALATTKGTLLKIVADIGLDVLAGSNETKIIMEYTNGFTNETKLAEKNISIIAPSQIITTNQIDIDETSIFTIDKDVDTIKVKNGQDAKTMQVTGQVINNLGTKVDGVQILGRIPSSGSKSIGGAVLGSNINTYLSAPLEVTGFNNAQVLYSNNIDEELDGTGWSEQATTDSKSYKIVLPEGMENRLAGGFRYTVTVPANLDYEQTAKANYGVFYNNNAQEGVRQNLVESRVLGIETGKAPDIKVNISAFDTNEGYEIKEGSTVREGQYITYKVEVKNAGTIEANDVKVRVNLPDGLNLIEESQATGMNSMKYTVVSSYIRELEKNFDSIQGNSNEIIEFKAQINKQIYDQTDNDISIEQNKIELSTEVSANILEQLLVNKFSVNNSKGTLAINLTSDANKYIEPHQEINYRIKLDNVNREIKNNVKVILKLPNGIKYIGTKKYYNSQYDENNNSVTVLINELEGAKTEIIEIKCKNESELEEEFKIQAVTYCDESLEEIKSNEETHINNVAKKTIIAKQMMNSISNLTDKDDIVFYTNIENTSSFEQQIEYFNNISSSLDVYEFTIKMDGEVLRRGKTNYIDEILEIPANKTIQVTVITHSLPIQRGESIQIQNQPVIRVKNGDQIDVEKINTVIDGTNPTEYEEKNENILYEKENKEETQNLLNKPVEEETYRITGNIWYDKNSDGEKNPEEDRISGIIVELKDLNNNVIIDNDGNELVEATNNFGEYSFNNIKPGNYILQVKYDNKDYDITHYKAEGLEEEINSDFIKYESDNTEYAVTDIINVTNGNIYNIDLGLTKIEQLNLSVSQSISKISIINNNKIREIETNESSSKLELTNSELKDSVLLVEYKIIVTNYGEVAGFAKEIKEYVPEGMKFNSEMNPEWFMSKEGYLCTADLGNTIINQGESKSIKLILSKRVKDGSIGILRGKAEVKTTYSESVLSKIKAKAAKQVNSESNVSISNLTITKRKNITIISMGITLGIISLLILAIYEIKKNIIDKTNCFEKLQ